MVNATSRTGRTSPRLVSNAMLRLLTSRSGCWFVCISVFASVIHHGGTENTENQSATDGAQMNTDKKQRRKPWTCFYLCPSVPHLWLLTLFSPTTFSPCSPCLRGKS